MRIAIAISFCVGVNTSAFTQESRTWWVSYKGEGRFKELKTSYDLGYGVIGDFNGDGKSDVYRNWQVSYGGTSEWTPLRNLSVSFLDLRFGDFNGDGKTDVFHRPVGDSRDWLVSYGGVGEWIKINESAAELTELAFGDFDGDGKTDVFYRPEGDSRDWKVSYGGVGKWKIINESAAELTELAFGDFDGDGKTDVFYRPKGDSRDWKVSYGGVGKWKIINESAAELTELAFGDFDGDGKTDVFHFGFPLPPNRPKDLRSSVSDSTNIIINWRDDSNSEDGFIVSWIGKKTGYTEVNGSQKVGINRESYTLTNCNSSTEYCFNVKAFHGGGKSISSETTCATTPASNPPPTQGISKLYIYNCHNEERSVRLWTFDYTSGVDIWTDNGILSSQWTSGRSCPGGALPKEITLMDGHSYKLVAIDGICNGNPNQVSGSCWKLESDIISGKSNGSALIITVN